MNNNHYNYLLIDANYILKEWNINNENLKLFLLKEYYKNKNNNFKNLKGFPKDIKKANSNKTYLKKIGNNK